MKANYVENKQKKGIEIRFDGIPAERVRDELKANGFRWSKWGKFWYAKKTDERLELAIRLTQEKLRETSGRWKKRKSAKPKTEEAVAETVQEEPVEMVEEPAETAEVELETVQEVQEAEPELTKDKKLLQAVKSIQKTGCKDTRQFLGAIYEENGKNVILDNCRIIRTTEAIGTAEDFPDKFKTERIFNQEWESEIKLPTEKELREAIKKAKADFKEKNGKRAKSVMYRFENGLALNAEWLLDGIKATEAEVLRYAGIRKPVVLQNDKTEYLLLPIANAGEFTGIKAVA